MQTQDNPISSNTDIENSSIPLTPPTPSPKNSKPLIIILIGTIILLSFIIVGIVGYFIGLNTEKTKTEQFSSKVFPHPTPTPVTNTPIPTVLPKQISGNFKTQLYDPNSLIFNQEPLPILLTKFTTNELVGLECSPLYSNDYQGNYVSNDATTQKQVKLTDSETLRLIKIIETSKSGKTIGAVKICRSDTGLTLTDFGIKGGGGGMNNIAYFGVIEEDKINTFASISNPGVAYFGCQTPLQLTKNNELFYKCSGGDGGSATEIIYKIDMISGKVEQLKYCQSTIPNEGGSALITCK